MGIYLLWDWASGAKAAREALEGMNATAEKWGQTRAKSLYSNEGMDFFGLSKESFTIAPKNARDWLDKVLAVWSDGKTETDEIVSGYASSFTTLTENTKSALTKLKETAEQGGHTNLASGIQKDMDKLDKANAEIEKLLKKKQNKK